MNLFTEVLYGTSDHPYERDPSYKGPSVGTVGWCADRVLDGPASGKKGLKDGN